MLYFNVIRNLIKENTHCIFRNGRELPEDLDELCIVEISINRGGILIFECC